MEHAVLVHRLGLLYRGETEQSVCSVCLDAMDDPESRVVLCSNGHVFHVECAHRWLRTRKTTCPNCRERVQDGMRRYVDLCRIAAHDPALALHEWSGFRGVHSMLRMLVRACRQAHTGLAARLADAVVDAHVDGVRRAGGDYDSLEETLMMQVLRSSQAACVIATLHHRNAPGGVEYVTPTGDTVLLRAIDAGRADVVDVLIRQLGANVAHTDGRRRTALMRAATADRAECVRLLAALAEVDVDARQNGSGPTALMMACRDGHDECVDILLRDADAGLDSVTDSKGWTALFYAAAGGQEDTVRLLAEEYDAEVDLGDAIGRTPLLIAASEGHERVVGALLELGSDARAVTAHGQSPLFAAIEGGSLECVRSIVGAGADVRARGSAHPRFSREHWDAMDDTPLTLAVTKDRDMVELLLDAGADVDAADGIGRTALMVAAATSDADTARLLLERGADAEKRDSRGRTARDVSRLPQTLTDELLPERPSKRPRVAA